MKTPKTGERLVIKLQMPDGTPGSVTYLFTSNTLQGKIEAVNIPAGNISREFTRLLSAGGLCILGGVIPNRPAEAYLECVDDVLRRLKRRWPSFKVLTVIPSPVDLSTKGAVY